MLSSRLIATIALAASAYAAPAPPFVDSNRAELIKSAPELTKLEFDPDQSALDPLLRATGQQLESMVARFIDVSIAEDVHEMRFDSAHLIWKDQREKFQYVIETRPFAEVRRQASGGEAVLPNAKSVFLVAGGFVDMLSDLLPANQSKSRFRYLGRITEGGATSLVVAFIEQDGIREGLAWVDQASKRIVRFRADVLKHPEGEKFDSFTRDVRFVPVNFSAQETNLWLPSSATVHVRFSTGELHSVHRFSDYHVLGSEKDTGQAPAPVGTEDNAFEVLLKGAAALEAEKPGNAIAPLLDAAGRLPERVEPGYYLGLALFETHDLTGAETQFRETVKRSPSFAAAHNQLGAVLFERGDRTGAVPEFQEALRLEPGNSKIRANLDGAMTEPAAKNLALDAPPSAAPGDINIKVNVRQVLVPAVVTDKEGHSVTGLTEADFKVFEDGVEQKITSFSSEHSDVSATPNHPDSLTAAGPAQPKPQVKRRTYVICLDMLHAGFSNFVHVREALQKLFREEQPGDSQYVVIALGRTIQVVQDTTTDPAKVVATLSGAEFKKIYQQSQQGASEFEISRFEADLQEIRSACDAKDPICEIQKPNLPRQARALSDHELFRTNQFASEFRAVVEQVARANGRRTLILISDGFPLAPGRVPFGLLEAYFPEFRSTQTIETVQDVMQPVFKLAVKGNVPVYTIDSRGLYTPPAFDASRGVNVSAASRVMVELNSIATDEGQTLSEIASATGGKAFQNSNDLSAGLKQAFADGRDYYMLAYVPSNEAQDGKFRKIEVTLRNKKASVSAKRGYWAPSQ